MTNKRFCYDTFASNINHADLALIDYFRTVALGQFFHPLDHAPGDLAFGEQRPAALRQRPAEALVDRMDADLFELVVGEVANREHVLPVGGVARMALLAAVGAGV